MVDGRLRTSNKHVYAIGDVTGAPKLSHLANHHAGLVIRNALFRTPVDADRCAVPSVTYTDPELAQVGLIEDAARAQPASFASCAGPIAKTTARGPTGATNGHIKIVTDRKGDILGATIVGASASEKIAAWTLAINQKLNIDAFADVIVTVSDLFRGRQTRRDDLFHTRFDEPSGAAHHRVAASFWLTSVR